MLRFLCVAAWCFLGSLAASTTIAAAALPLSSIKLPPKFTITLYAEAPGARSLALGPDGVVFVGTRDEGKVYAVKDKNRDGVGETVKVLADKLDTPNGVAFHQGDLYVAEHTRVVKFANVGDGFGAISSPKVIYKDFPDDRSHGWKFLAIGPDGKLYVPVGAPCNICDPDADAKTRGKYARIFRMNLDGSGLEEVARGVRNTVGYDWHPLTKELWFTDNGRDRLGNDLPPDELNRIRKTGLHFGYPYFHGSGIKDPEFGGKAPKSFTFEKPMRELGPHVAALGLAFYTGKMFPEPFANQIFIAEHGSWNRDTPIGYRVSLVRETKSGYTYEPFATGWLDEKNNVWGRPVDVLVMPDGSLLVSDDKAGALYRIAYKK